ncbi:hypothetical protein SPSIL_038490 [Sporomusa silvacetica DSM 10669]|uniref:Uncharacterized protein n=1 Tax=Sporomusa silvacetica DSM 10669 TaxID=1123289 RepID=A0ABZ3IPJ8_9FIRM|nr:hypothetical protein [Sporomusa silvacetica]OZC14100.1 hypothetical protein SPSIL_50410 [Sporomusa silvacetica DSM 10669]
MRLKRWWRLFCLLIFSLYLAAPDATASGYQLLATYWAPIVIKSRQVLITLHHMSPSLGKQAV